jgi:exosortase A
MHSGLGLFVASVESHGPGMNAPITTPLALAPTQAEPQLRLPVLVVLLAALALVVVYGQTASSIVAIWQRSETFVHGFLVVPICLLLAWGERANLAALTARPWWPGLLLVFAAGGLWFVAAAGNVGAAQQFALAFMIQATVVTVAGKDVSRVLFFSLAFLLFAVPAGELFIPTFIDWTADFTVAALRFSGVPVYREGNHFMIPSGAWSVVEACSGVRYLIASTMVGVLYAAITYRSTRRRVLFVIASILVPIVANWLRAYLIVMIGHLSNNRLAVGVDHLVYGWIFFGFVMLLLLWVGSWWREDPRPASLGLVGLAAVAHQTRPASTRALVVAAVAAVAAASVWQPLAATMERPYREARVPVIAALPGTTKWQPTTPFVNWKPRYQGHIRELAQCFQADGAPVGVYVAYYANQEKGRELITSGNLLVARDDWTWKQVAKGTASADWAGAPATFHRATLAGNAGPLETWQLFWIDGQATESPYVAKALLAWAKIRGHDDGAALIVFYTPANVGNADDRLRSFSQAMSASVDGSLAALRERSQ